MGILHGMSKGATVIVIMIMTSFFAAGILVLTFMFNKNMLITMYEMGLWPLVYMFMGIWFLATCLTVIILWLILRKRVTVGDVLAD